MEEKSRRARKRGGAENPGAVEGVSQDGVSVVAEVDANLVRASGEDLHIKKGGLVKALGDAVARNGQSSFVGGDHSLAQTRTRSGQVLAQFSLSDKRKARDKGQITARGGMLGELLAQSSCRAFAQGKGYSARGSSIETMSGSHKEATPPDSLIA